MIIIINYDSKQSINPEILEKGLFIIPKSFVSTQDAEEYILSSPKLPFDICMMVNVEPVPPDLSVPQKAQLWLNTVLGREESFVPIELFESESLHRCDTCVFGSTLNLGV